VITPVATVAAANQNACKQCAPLGASLAFRGIEGAMLVIHGSQGCATYIRRYLISHFREPFDIASSSLDERAAIFGGEANLHQSLRNVQKSYEPRLIGVATTCLSETIGEDVAMALGVYESNEDVALVPVSTPSYQGTHAEGFHRSVRAILENLAATPGAETEERDDLLLFPGMVSPADLRHLRAIGDAFGLRTTLVPDYGDTLDGAADAEYRPIPPGGTPHRRIRAADTARCSLFFGTSVAPEMRASHFLQERFGVPETVLPLPIGVRNTDAMIELLRSLSGRETPVWLEQQRGRLLDAYVDAHKIVFGKRVVVFGEEDLVTAMVAFLREIGMHPVLAATGGASGALGKGEAAGQEPTTQYVADADFAAIAEHARRLQPELLVGTSKGYPLARELDVPLVRIGFPIHDRVGAQRLRHLGYAGTQSLFDRLVNEVLRQRQDRSAMGFSYL
jgi:nitrogenase molybdenum-iron protein NifN